MKNRKVPAWAKVQLTATERKALSYCVEHDGAPTQPESPKDSRVFSNTMQRLRRQGVISWNEDGGFLTDFGRYSAMRNPATEPR